MTYKANEDRLAISLPFFAKLSFLALNARVVQILLFFSLISEQIQTTDVTCPEICMADNVQGPAYIPFDTHFV